MKSKIVTLALLTATFASFNASAADVGQHPAVFAPRTLPGIEASTFIVGHPAGGKAGRASKADTATAPAQAGTAEKSGERVAEQKLAQKAAAVMR